MPVISGYTSAAALIVATSQIKGLLGLKFDADSFVDTVTKVIAHAGEAKVYDSDIRAGLPEIKFPGFSYVNTEGNNISFINVLEDLGVGLISLTVVAISSHIVVAKIFTRGTRLKASQEIIAMGASNLLGSFVGSMPVCASFSRSAVNNTSDVDQQTYWVITPIKGLLFPSSAYLQKKVIYQAQNYNTPEMSIVVFNLTHVAQTDYSTGQVLKEVITDLKRTFKDCIIINANNTVLKQLQLLLPNLDFVSSLEPATKRFSFISLGSTRKRLSVISLEPIQKKMNDLPQELQDVSNKYS
ncbi:unnamed protein product [Nezara viridula]|uniref:SLC26A/SulP transporter domain-containing protein n=1 Tax=Nezara viridula TaxID=85310 RepID=A0A9P0E499_NEZVI|nr:unnamed protein product [Nezara viridula]